MKYLPTVTKIDAMPRQLDFIELPISPGVRLPMLAVAVVG